MRDAQPERNTGRYKIHDSLFGRQRMGKPEKTQDGFLFDLLKNN